MRLIKVRAPSYRGDYRYFLVEAEGSCFSGYVQRPAAERHAKQGGYGIWDARENKLILPPRFDQRVRALVERKAVLERKVRETQGLINAIEAERVAEEEA